ncbi:hypothetical protein [Ammoniphilus sp. 3BR4]|uniref:hypothetical protein n=1 Tax=Ammoniphilus sp. 3BR4 TaxID=3158265 RepID=UPI0034670E52
MNLQEGKGGMPSGLVSGNEEAVAEFIIELGQNSSNSSQVEKSKDELIPSSTYKKVDTPSSNSSLLKRGIRV